MKKSFIHQQEEISFVKNTFTQYLIDKLDVVEVQGPILSKVGDGMQDNLSGIENPVTVNVLASDSRRDIRSCSLISKMETPYFGSFWFQ